MDKHEVLIACVLEKAKYWLVGADHTEAEGHMLDHDRGRDIFIPHEYEERQSRNERRKMMTDTGRVVDLDEAWRIADAGHYMDQPLEQYIDAYTKSWKTTREKAVHSITVLDFEKALKENMNLHRAFAYAETHNHEVKKQHEAEHPPTMAEIWASRQQGD